jgi:hypothetical protein
MIAVIRSVIAAGRIGGHAVAKRAAEQRMDGLAERLSPQIPQRDVDRADRLDISALPAEIAREGVKLLPGFHRLVGAGVDKERRKHIIDARRDRAWRPVLTALAPAGQTIVGLDLDLQTVALGKPRLG